MSIREKLADWLTGGDYRSTVEDNMRLYSRIKTRDDALDAIIAMETPSCAPIGKRMAKRAREGRK